MVFTLLHYLSVVSLQFKKSWHIEPIALFLSTTLMDVEPLTEGITGRYHGFLHSFVGAALLAVVITCFAFYLESKKASLVSSVLKLVRLKGGTIYSFRQILATSLFGSMSHVLIDSLTHRTFPYVLYPLVIETNPFWQGFEVGHTVQAITILLSIFSLYLWMRTIRQ